MGRAILAFLVIFGVFFLGISLFWHSRGATKVKMAKLLAYSALCSVLTMVVIVGLVVLF